MLVAMVVMAPVVVVVAGSCVSPLVVKGMLRMLLFSLKQDPMDVSDFLEPSSLVLPTQNRVRGGSAFAAQIPFFPLHGAFWVGSPKQELTC